MKIILFCILKKLLAITFKIRFNFYLADHLFSDCLPILNIKQKQFEEEPDLLVIFN